MSSLPVSVIIVSRDRPESLRRLLFSLRFQKFQNFETVIVTNAMPADILPEGVSRDNVKFLSFDAANISAARNAGIEISAGDILAFIDDDAVPEPVWLEKLVACFDDPKVGVAGGYVRGRNGISFQWRGTQTNSAGRDRELDVPFESGVFQEHDGWFPRVHGTNAAFRKSAVIDLGGFDPVFSFFLDETDLCLRASAAGWKTAIVPLAEVQHGFEQSDRRTHARVPLGLGIEAQSKAYFLRKHASGDAELEKTMFLESQDRRLIGLMTQGLIGPEEVTVMRQQLSQGWAEGERLEPGNHVVSQDDSQPFCPYSCHQNLGNLSLLARPLNFAAAKKRAKELSRSGKIVTIFCFSRTALFHRCYFDEDGFWVQTGGLLGKSHRNEPLISFFTTSARMQKEEARLSDLRHL